MPSLDLLTVSSLAIPPQTKQKLQEATVDDKVAMLEVQKHDLLRQKGEIEAKLGDLRARMRANAAKAEASGDESSGSR